MTDFTPPPSPTSSIRKFGTSIVGKEFEWDKVSDDGTTVGTVKARAAASIAFEDTLRYTTGRHAQLVQTARSSKEMREKLEAISSTEPDYVERFNELIAQRLEFEQAAYASSIDVLLILVNENDREALRPALIAGDPRQVNELRTWLEQEVLGMAAQDAAVASGVDPTLPTSPPESASDPDSGGESEPKESSSTD